MTLSRSVVGAAENVTLANTCIMKSHIYFVILKRITDIILNDTLVPSTLRLRSIPSSSGVITAVMPGTMVPICWVQNTPKFWATPTNRSLMSWRYWSTHVSASALPSCWISYSSSNCEWWTALVDAAVTSQNHVMGELTSRKYMIVVVHMYLRTHSGTRSILKGLPVVQE